MHNKHISCDICGKSFTEKRYLIDHICTYHISSKFDCKKCSKHFKSQLKLKFHQRSVHGKKKFKCDKCNAAFVFPGLLTEHVKVKHEGKSYHCSYPGCLKQSSLKCNAAAHLRKDHNLNGDAHKKYCKIIKLR